MIETEVEATVTLQTTGLIAAKLNISSRITKETPATIKKLMKVLLIIKKIIR